MRPQLPADDSSQYADILERLRRIENAVGFEPYAEAQAFSGPWDTASPGVTTGVLFTLPREGRVLIDCGSTGYVSTATNLFIEVWVDGASTGQAMALLQSFPTFTRLTLGPCKIAMNLSAGEHYVAFKQTVGTSDGNDYGAISVIMA